MEHPKSWISSGVFAFFCGTTKETLWHYRDMGLLIPVHRGENGCFYYDAEQFYDFYAVSLFRQTGTPLEDVRRCLWGRNAADTLVQLRVQQKRLERERRELEQTDFQLGAIYPGVGRAERDAISRLYNPHQRADGLSVLYGEARRGRLRLRSGGLYFGTGWKKKRLLCSPSGWQGSGAVILIRPRRAVDVLPGRMVGKRPASVQNAPGSDKKKGKIERGTTQDRGNVI